MIPRGQVTKLKRCSQLKGSRFQKSTFQSMASEESPLLSAGNYDRDAVYLRFSSKRKNMILLMVSRCGLIQRKSHLPAVTCIKFSHFMNSFCDRNLYTINTTDCQGSEYNGCGYQVIHFPFIHNRGIHLYVSSIAVSISLFAASLGGLVAASYSTFCKFRTESCICHEFERCPN